ncbi:MAG: hypothetical protein ABGY96_29510 [bacterium]
MNKSIQDLTTRRGEQDAVDLQLLQRVANKDRKAFEQLYSRQYPPIKQVS